ncbi:MAG: U32 family peptidase [Bdellovibrionales bacterium]|nr:U32 family peptidase [Bdellovibrionales bacterium]
MSHFPELLSPAGSLEKLKLAVLYGADAVYIGGQKYGLRTASENFTDGEIEEGVLFAKKNGVKVYVVLNGFLHDSDFEYLQDFIIFIEKAGVDAVIVSDPGVISLVSEHSKLDIHLSTQASCLNIEAGKLWKKAGVKRLVLGREVSIESAKRIKSETGLEIEMFVHGSMCIAYSGNCVISNYTSGRDSNRGGCAHSCRFNYNLKFKDKDVNSFFMSSKDLSGIHLLNQYKEAGIDSLKVEGRMKSFLYVATISKVYADALQELKIDGTLNNNYISELKKVSHREYTEANLVKPAGEESIYSLRENEIQEYCLVGMVIEIVENKFIILEVRSAFNEGDNLEILPFKRKGDAFPIQVDRMYTLTGEAETRTRPGSLVKIPYVPNVEVMNIVRKKLVGISCN